MEQANKVPSAGWPIRLPVKRARKHGDMLKITGTSVMEFTDDFSDPLNLGIEPGGTPYHISGDWVAVFSADVFADEQRGDYRDQSQN